MQSNEVSTIKYNIYIIKKVVPIQLKVVFLIIYI